MNAHKSYLLMTPGPLTTTASVKAAMLRDVSTWDDDYHEIVGEVRDTLVRLATETPDDYTCVLMQGSGTFGIESTIGSVVPRDGKLLVLSNGAYGLRMAHIAATLGVTHDLLIWDETETVQVDRLQMALSADPSITHVAMVHVETTTGILNPIYELATVAHDMGKTVMVDAMSSFGGIPLDMQQAHIDVLVSSSNKCIQGVPGFCFVVARTELMHTLHGNARSVSLDLFDQWHTMETNHHKWRFTSPTHAVLAFQQALQELAAEGGIAKRYQRYRRNQVCLASGMEQLGFSSLLPPAIQSPIITTFLYPVGEPFSFATFYEDLKASGFVIYPGKLTVRETLRVGTIGDMQLSDIEAFLQAADHARLGQRRAAQ